MSTHPQTAILPGPMLGRLLGAAPDVITGIACLIVWISPLTFGQGAVKTVVLMMLMEFLLVHGTGFFTVVALLEDVSRVKRLLAMSGLLCFYALFVGAFVAVFRAWWPVWVFLWLAASKAIWIFAAPRDREAETARQMGAWAFSVVVYLAAVFGGVILPLPRLGITEELLPTLGLPGSGEWIERPHTAVAGMAFYYFAMAAFKGWRGGAMESAVPPPLKKGD
ncbi:hypothetical protein FCE95_11730 [Luteimonas gilva]|uniref:Uncharacterized protein n=1 Tax=Luteimonas gilva TaxID=2572684 RepID=A0A4U5JM83_9GAMM|nr:hypothetical protein [Luteimonas gilva]TKR30762.1 hypothetical protein FCE95_11730 [Luteimonas gilva]